MSLQDHWNILRFAVFPLLLGVGAISLILIFCYKIVDRTGLHESIVFIPVMALLGGIVGICTGASRLPVVGTVLPGFLTLMTAFFGYAFTKEGLAKTRSIIPYALAGMLLTTLYFSFVGSKIRFENEIFASKDQRELLRFERIELELEKARKFKEAGIGSPEPRVEKPDVRKDPSAPELLVPKPN